MSLKNTISEQTTSDVTSKAPQNAAVDIKKEQKSPAFLSFKDHDTQQTKFIFSYLEEEAAKSLAQKKDSFTIGEYVLDARYVQDFIALVKAKNAKLLENPFFLDVLAHSSQKGKTGQCFGKKFASADECFGVMEQIYTSRNAHTVLYTLAACKDPRYNVGAVKKANEEAYEKMLDAAQKQVEYQGKKYDITLDMPSEIQYHYFKNINADIESGLDFETVGHLHRTLWRNKDDKGKVDALERLHTLMKHCGSPAIRNVHDDHSPVGWIAGKQAHFTPDFIGSGGTLYLPNIDDLPAELAHAFRHHNNTFGEKTQFVRDGLKDILTLNSWGFTREAQHANYLDRDKMEYDAHRNVEPAICRYLSGKIDTIEEMYAAIDLARKEKGISYSQSSESEKIAQRGYDQQRKKIIKMACAGLKNKSL